MDPIKRDVVLIFVLANGLSASEGNIDALINHQGDYFIATHPETKDLFLINLRNVLTIQEIPRSELRSGPSRLVVPKTHIN